MDGKCSPGDDSQASERALRRRRTELLKLRRHRGLGQKEFGPDWASKEVPRMAYTEASMLAPSGPLPFLQRLRSAAAIVG